MPLPTQHIQVLAAQATVAVTPATADIVGMVQAMLVRLQATTEAAKPARRVAMLPLIHTTQAMAARAITVLIQVPAATAITAAAMYLPRQAIIEAAKVARPVPMRQAILITPAMAAQAILADGPATMDIARAAVPA